MLKAIHELVQHWRDQATTVRRYGADGQATLLEACAKELDVTLCEAQLEELTLPEAAQESGYSYSTIQKMVGTGKLPNVGKKHGPRVRRGDLPRKPGQLSQRNGGEPDLAGQILLANQ